MTRTRPILVAGRTGQLARCLTDQTTVRGLSAIAVEHPQLDLENADSIERMVASTRPRAIINAAAYTAVDKAEAESERAFAVNRDGAARLAAAAARLRIPFVHVSTDYVFDGRKETPYREQDAPAPLGVYGRSKLEGEDAVRSACPAALVLRTSWLYSQWGQNFVTKMLELAQTRDVVRVVDDQRGAPTSARDLAAAILDVVEQVVADETRGRAGLYHVTASGDTTWHRFAAAIFAGWARRGHRVPKVEPIKTSEFPSAARRPANSRLDCTKFAQAFGIRLPPWEHSLERCLDRLAGAPAEAPRC